MGLVVAGFAVGAAKMLESRYQRPDYDAAAAFIDRNASARDVVIDAAVFSPGPLTGLEVALDEPRPGVPRRVRRRRGIIPLGSRDRVAPAAEVTDRAVAAAGSGPLFVVIAARATCGFPRYEQLRTTCSARCPGVSRSGGADVSTARHPGPPTGIRAARRCGSEPAPVADQRLAARTTLWAHTRRRTGVRSAARSAEAAAPSRRAA